MYAELMENKWIVEKWKYYHLPWVASRTCEGGVSCIEGFGCKCLFMDFETWQEAFDYAFNRAISAYLTTDEQSSTDYQ